jgi:hypothetical protein
VHSVHCSAGGSVLVAVLRQVLGGRPGSPYPGVTLRMKPSEYWRQNFSITFEDDEIGIRTLDYIGVNNLIRGSDDPHGD